VRLQVRGLDANHPTPTAARRRLCANLDPESEFPWLLLVHLGTARAFEVVMTWTEGDVECSEAQHLSI
jgi:hypothetical protein